LPPRATRDSTRTIAVVALVLSGVAVLGQLVSGVVPLLAFGAFGLVDPGFEEDPGPGASTATDSSFRVDVPGAWSEQPVDGVSLASALAVTDPLLGRSLRCEDVPLVRPGALGVCRTLDEPTTYVVVELDGAGHGDVRLHT
jgi:hypothetical protein